jgi:nucleotide-binding universal stress UspA family protein
MDRRPIVVGVDGSPESRRAVELAWEIARTARADLIPLHAVPDLWLAEGLERAADVPPVVREALVHDSRNGIERFLQGTSARTARAHLEVRTGPAALAIAAVARRRRAQLVVIGGRHHGALARGAGRSTAHYLVRTLDVPLLVVGRSRRPVKRILAAVDLSPASSATLSAARRLTEQLGARLRVIHVVQPLRFMFLIVDALDQTGFEERSRRAFDRLTTPLANVAPEDRALRTGPVAKTILAEAAAWRADLLVTGSHGKGWADRVLLGSTTERLLSASPVSVLVVPTARKGARAVPPRKSLPRRYTRVIR